MKGGLTYGIYSKYELYNWRGKTTSLNLSGVKTTLTKQEVFTLKDLIIEKNIFVVSSGALVAKSGAKFTERKVTKFDVA